MKIFRDTAYKLPTKFMFFQLILCLVMISACAGPQNFLPAITPKPTDSYNVGSFVWRDLLTNDVSGTKRFYGELFNWEFKENSLNNVSYTTIKKNDTLIGGIIYLKRKDEKISESRWLSYLSVPDVDQAVEYVRNDGGTVLKDPKDISGRGRIAVVRDPQGAMLALLRTNGGDPSDNDFSTGKWMLNELWTTDVASAITFYKTLAAFKQKTTDLPTGEKYHQLTKAERIRAGVVQVPWDDVKPNWLPYIAVSDISATIKLAKALGGKVLIDPGDTINDDSVAVIADPSGAAFAIQNIVIDEKAKGDSQ